MNWQYLEIDEVSLIHQQIIHKAGTKAGVRDFSLLHSAVERPKATYNGLDLYPTLWLKAAALLHSLCLNHPFSDGNKRTSWMSAIGFCHLNGYHLNAKTKSAVNFIKAVDNEKLPLPTIASWLKKHSQKM